MLRAAVILLTAISAASADQRGAKPQTRHDPVAVRFRAPLLRDRTWRGPTVLIDPYPDIGFDPAALARRVRHRRLPARVRTVRPIAADRILRLRPALDLPGARRRDPPAELDGGAAGVVDERGTGRDGLTLDGLMVLTMPSGPRSQVTVVATDEVRIVHLGSLADGAEYGRGVFAQEPLLWLWKADLLMVPAGGAVRSTGRRRNSPASSRPPNTPYQ